MIFGSGWMRLWAASEGTGDGRGHQQCSVDVQKRRLDIWTSNSRSGYSNIGSKHYIFYCWEVGWERSPTVYLSTVEVDVQWNLTSSELDICFNHNRDSKTSPTSTVEPYRCPKLVRCGGDTRYHQLMMWRLVQHTSYRSTIPSSMDIHRYAGNSLIIPLYQTKGM